MVLSQAVSLLLVASAVAVLPGIARMLRIPASVIEILFGVILGKSLLNLQLGGEYLDFLAELGFLVLMFHAGMEINFNMLKRTSTGRLAMQVALFAVTLVLAFLAAWSLGRGMFMALVLTTTSLGLVMPALRDAGLSRTQFGQSVLISATLADFLTLLGITFVVLWKNYGLSWQFAFPLPLFVAFGIALWALRLWAWWNPERAERLFLGAGSQEQGVRMALAMLFIFVGLSELVHLEPVLGAFMGGCIISFVLREKEELESKISAIGFGFLVPLFFINVGMQFDLTNILNPRMMTFTGALLLLALAVKLIPGMLLVLTGIKLREGVSAGLLLSSRLSLIVAAASIGVREGFISAELKDSIVLLALLTCFLGPVLFKLSLRGRSAGSASGA
jgi:Kef-type K+ transport system membrane component KefB